MNEAEAGEFIEQLKIVDVKTQERTYGEVAAILGWENADAVRAFIVESEQNSAAQAKIDSADDNSDNIKSVESVEETTADSDDIFGADAQNDNSEIEEDSADESDKN